MKKNRVGRNRRKKRKKTSFNCAVSGGALRKGGEGLGVPSIKRRVLAYRQTSSKGRKTKNRKRTTMRKGSSAQQHFVRGKPLKPHRKVEKARRVGVYGCGEVIGKRRCRWFGVSERAAAGKRNGSAVVLLERALKVISMRSGISRGPDRKRKEREARQGEYSRGTVRAWKIKRALPVRGQRTSTNGKTARRLNGKRG